MDIGNNVEGGRRLRDWWEGTPESVKGETYGEGQNLSKVGFVKVLANGRNPPSPPH